MADSASHHRLVHGVLSVLLTLAPGWLPASAAMADNRVQTLVKNYCSSCHGMDGVKAQMGAPYIAGLDRQYQFSALLTYQHGTRDNPDMQQVVAGLSMPQLSDLAGYYASLDTPWQQSHPGNRRSAAVSLPPQQAKAGALLAKQCNSCHGEKGNNRHDSVVPSLAAMPPDYFIDAMNQYFDGRRSHQLMQRFRDALSPQQLEQLAAYYALQLPLKPPPPNRGDAVAGERLAAPCVGCHGLDGNVLNPAIPQLSGHSAQYLYKAMRDYRQGHRSHEVMQQVLRHFDSAQLLDIAAHYAQQQPQPDWLRRQTVGKWFDPRQQGQRIAASCDACHGERQRMLGVPVLTGLDPAYLVDAAVSYRDGRRHHPEMSLAVSQLSDIELESAAFYYAALPASVTASPITADLPRGRALAADCLDCHTHQGREIPSLAGQDAAYMQKAMQAYMNGKRMHVAMQQALAAFSVEDMRDVSVYFSGLPASSVFAGDRVRRLITDKCDRCHGKQGWSQQPGVPRLAGQSEAYLALALKEYQDGRRKDNYMNSMPDHLNLRDIKAIAAYYSQQQR